MHVTTGGSDNHMQPETNPVDIRTRSVTISRLLGKLPVMISEIPLGQWALQKLAAISGLTVNVLESAVGSLLVIRIPFQLKVVQSRHPISQHSIVRLVGNRVPSSKCSVRDETPFPKEHRLYFCGSFVLHVGEHVSASGTSPSIGRGLVVVLVNR